MRVLLATYWAVPSVTGVGRYIANIKRGLESLGHTVDVLAHDPVSHCVYKTGECQPVERHLLTKRLESRLAPVYSGLFKAQDPLVLGHETGRYSFEMAASLLGVEGYDIVQTHDAVSCRALSRLLPRGAPLVGRFGGWLTKEMVAYGQTHGSALGERYLALEERLGLLATPHRFVPSHWLKQVFVENFGLDPATIRVVHSGIPVQDVLKQAAEEPGETPDAGGRTIILCPARLAPYKGHHLLLEAIAALAARRHDFVCWLAGEGPMQAELEGQVKSLGIREHVAFLGNRSDIYALMARADVVVLPSLLDSLPHAVQEAQVIGKPVVAFAVCGLPEMIVHGTTGLLVQPSDAAALAAELERLLADPPLRAGIAAQAAEWGRAHWNARRMTTETLAIYRGALRRR